MNASRGSSRELDWLAPECLRRAIVPELDEPHVVTGGPFDEHLNVIPDAVDHRCPPRRERRPLIPGPIPFAHYDPPAIGAHDPNRRRRSRPRVILAGWHAIGRPH